MVENTLGIKSVFIIIIKYTSLTYKMNSFKSIFAHRFPNLVQNTMKWNGTFVKTFSATIIFSSIVKHKCCKPIVCPWWFGKYNITNIVWTMDSYFGRTFLTNFARALCLQMSLSISSRLEYSRSVTLVFVYTRGFNWISLWLYKSHFRFFFFI